MTSPVGHFLGALIVTQVKSATSKVSRRELVEAKSNTLTASLIANWKFYLFVVVAANAPDLDFLPGIAIGQFGAFHHGPSHSLLAVLLFGLLVYVVFRLFHVADVWRWVSAGSLAYGSHLLLDLFTTDEALPYGMQLYWPLSSEYILGPFSVFTDIHHGGLLENLQASLPLIFSVHNLGAIGLELLILSPLLWFVNRAK